MTYAAQILDLIKGESALSLIVTAIGLVLALRVWGLIRTLLFVVGALAFYLYSPLGFAIVRALLVVIAFFGFTGLLSGGARRSTVARAESNESYRWRAPDDAAAREDADWFRRRNDHVGDHTDRNLVDRKLDDNDYR